MDASSETIIYLLAVAILTILPLMFIFLDLNKGMVGKEARVKSDFVAGKGLVEYSNKTWTATVDFTSSTNSFRKGARVEIVSARAFSVTIRELKEPKS